MTYDERAYRLAVNLPRSIYGQPRGEAAVPAPATQPEEQQAPVQPARVARHGLSESNLGAAAHMQRNRHGVGFQTN
jgi:hypothetical protein